MDIETPPWSQLADAKFWGLLVTVLAAASTITALGYTYLVYIFKQWIGSAMIESKQKNEAIVRLAQDAQDQTVFTLKRLEDNTHALSMLSETNRNVASMVERCPVRRSNEND